MVTTQLLCQTKEIKCSLCRIQTEHLKKDWNGFLIKVWWEMFFPFEHQHKSKLLSWCKTFPHLQFESDGTRFTDSLVLLISSLPYGNGYPATDPRMGWANARTPYFTTLKPTVQTHRTSSVGLMLTLDDKSYHKCLCLTRFYDEEKTGRPCRMQKASLTWEWTAGSVNINSAELLLNWPLCVETPDGKCLFLFLSAVKTWSLSLSTEFGMSGCAFGSVRSNTVARLSLSLGWHFIRMQTTRAV